MCFETLQFAKKKKKNANLLFFNFKNINYFIIIVKFLEDLVCKCILSNEGGYVCCSIILPLPIVYICSRKQNCVIIFINAESCTVCYQMKAILPSQLSSTLNRHNATNNCSMNYLEDTSLENLFWHCSLEMNDIVWILFYISPCLFF